MPLRKVHRVTKLQDVTKKIGPVAEALQNSRHLLPAGLLTPLVIDSSHFASRVGIFNQLDLGFFDTHGADLTISGIYQEVKFRNINFSADLIPDSRSRWPAEMLIL